MAILALSWFIARCEQAVSHNYTLNNRNLCLNRDLNRELELRSMEQEPSNLGMHWGVTGDWPEPRRLHFASSYLFQGTIKHVHSLQESIPGFLQSTYKSHWFSSQLRGLVFPVSNPSPGFPIIWLQLLSLQGGSLRPYDPSPFLRSLLGIRVLIWLLHFLSYLTPR